MRFMMPTTSKDAERSVSRCEPRKAMATQSCMVTGGGDCLRHQPAGRGYEPA